jgi:hypothetical protein
MELRFREVPHYLQSSFNVFGHVLSLVLRSGPASLI